ncbi:MAG: carboxypeptidase-like regulatory domain-containing protein, partial [Bacteroidota bacterium]
MSKISYTKIILPILMIAFTTLAYGQNATLTGKILDLSGKPLSFATVLIDGTTKGTTADKDGQFIINDIPAGTYTIKVSFMGYLSTTEEVSLKAGESIEKSFSLQEDALNIQAVVISGTRYELDRVNNPIVVNVINNKQLNATQSIAISEGLNFQQGVRVETNSQKCGF